VVRLILRRLSHLPSTPSLLRHIDVVVGRSEVTRLKPDPEGLLTACRLLDVAPSSAAYLGDATADIEAARNAGLRAGGVTTGLGSEEELRAAGATAVFATLGSVLAHLIEECATPGER
jgi:phosphoglycolate phosphatase-like HAD superfamily hydrolase